MINKLKKYKEILDDKFYNFNLEIKEYYGVNNSLINKIIKLFGFSKKGEITEPLQINIEILENYLRKNYKIGDNLKRILEIKYKKYLKIKSYRGFRHKYKLPANGQRTRVNAKTSKKQKIVNLKNKFTKDILILKKYVLQYSTEKNAKKL